MQKLRQSLQQHVLASKYYENVDFSGRVINNKFIELKIGKQGYATILGDELPIEMTDRPRAKEGESRTSRSSSDQKYKDGCIERVPTLFRIQHCIPG